MCCSYTLFKNWTSSFSVIKMLILSKLSIPFIYLVLKDGLQKYKAYKVVIFDSILIVID